jgi:hypothetical protein
MGMEAKEEGSKGPPFMEGSRRLWLPFICGVHACLERAGGGHTPSREVFYLSDC